MNKRVWISLATFAAFLAAIWWLDPFVLLTVGAGLLMWVALPAAAIGFVRLAIAVRQGSSRAPALNILASVAAFAVFFALAIPANRHLQAHAVAMAKAYPAQVTPLLEAYRTQHGKYPASLDAVPSAPAVPRLLRGTGGYRTTGDSYSFSFNVPGGFIDTWDYSSATGEWILTS